MSLNAGWLLTLGICLCTVLAQDDSPSAPASAPSDSRPPTPSLADRAATATPPPVICVDPRRGRDDASGDRANPLSSVSAAIARLPDPLRQSVLIELTAGQYDSTGGVAMPDNSLVLMRRMPPGVAVRLVGRRDASGGLPVLAWQGGEALVRVTEGQWTLENVQVGSGSTRQRRGIMATGPAEITLQDVTFRTRSQSDAGILAERGGVVLLRGAIRLNEHLHNEAPDETFCGIIAEQHGLVRFVQREGASLDMGNGSLSASYYGCIRLGCARARITSWSHQGNNLAINNGGRIDLHNTELRLCAKDKDNTPIGLEHDGHILGEGARITIEGANAAAIVLQKASTMACNDIELRGDFPCTIAAMSGSMFVGGFLSDVTRVEATTGASVNIEKVGGRLVGPVVARRCGSVSLPDRNVFSE